MPRVGSRYFAYTPKGKKAARKYAKRTGAKLHMHTKYSKRGMKY